MDTSILISYYLRADLKIVEYRIFIGNKSSLAFLEAREIQAVFEGRILQGAFAALVAGGAVKRMIGKDEFQYPLTRFDNFFGMCLHLHALGGSSGT